MLRQCLGSASAVEQPPTAIPSHKARPSQNWPKITTYDHVYQIFIISCTWFRRGVLCDRLNAWLFQMTTLACKMNILCFLFVYFSIEKHGLKLLCFHWASSLDKSRNELRMPKHDTQSVNKVGKTIGTISFSHHMQLHCRWNMISASSKITYLCYDAPSFFVIIDSMTCYIIDWQIYSVEIR